MLDPKPLLTGGLLELGLREREREREMHIFVYIYTYRVWGLGLVGNEVVYIYICLGVSRE